jgi:hypothetical protein
VTFLAVPAVAVVVLLAGAAGVTPPAVALAIGVCGAGLWASAHLVRAALDIHHTDGTFVACRGAGFIGLAALATGLTGVVALWAPPGAGVWATIGYAVATVLFCVGVLFLPGAARNWVVRVRRAFDGAGLGVSLAFAGYLVLPVQGEHVATLPVILLGSLGISIVVVAVLRSRPRGGPSVRCGAGSIAVMAALGVLTTMVVLDVGGAVLPLLGLPIVAGLAASADGGSRRHWRRPRSSRATPINIWRAIRCWPCPPPSVWSPRSGT